MRLDVPFRAPASRCVCRGLCEVTPARAMQPAGSGRSQGGAPEPARLRPLGHSVRVSFERPEESCQAASARGGFEHSCGGAREVVRTGMPRRASPQLRSSQGLPGSPRGPMYQNATIARGNGSRDWLCKMFIVLAQPVMGRLAHRHGARLGGARPRMLGCQAESMGSGRQIPWISGHFGLDKFHGRDSKICPSPHSRCSGRKRPQEPSWGVQCANRASQRRSATTLRSFDGERGSSSVYELPRLASHLLEAHQRQRTAPTVTGMATATSESGDSPAGCRRLRRCHAQSQPRSPTLTGRDDDRGDRFGAARRTSQR